VTSVGNAKASGVHALSGADWPTAIKDEPVETPALPALDMNNKASTTLVIRLIDLICIDPPI
jgi:hypothetical protein